MIGMLIWDRAGHGLRPVRMKEISVLHVRFLCGEVTALERTAAVARSHRLRTAGRRLLRQGVERVVLPEGSAADVLPKGLRPVSTLALRRAIAADWAGELLRLRQQPLAAIPSKKSCGLWKHSLRPLAACRYLSPTACRSELWISATRRMRWKRPLSASFPMRVPGADGYGRFSAAAETAMPASGRSWAKLPHGFPIKSSLRVTILGRKILRRLLMRSCRAYRLYRVLISGQWPLLTAARRFIVPFLPLTLKTSSSLPAKDMNANRFSMTGRTTSLTERFFVRLLMSVAQSAAGSKKRNTQLIAKACCPEGQSDTLLLDDKQ